MALRKPFSPRDSVQLFSEGIFKSLLTVLFFLNWSLRKNPPPRVREQPPGPHSTLSGGHMCRLQMLGVAAPFLWGERF